MIGKLPTALAVAAGLLPGSALACQYDPPEQVGYTTAQFFARRMVEAAAYVDVVLLEDDGTRALGEPPTGILTLRSIARLKGDGADRFSLFGSGVTLSPDAERIFARPLEHFTQHDGRVTAFPYSEERPGRLFPQRGVAPPPPQLNSCSPPAVAGQTGRFYVVMRGADGRLLDRVPLYDGVMSPAFAFVPVTLGEGDVWLQAVHGASRGAVAATQPRVLHLRPGADPARIEGALRRAGVTTTAAFVRRGDWWDEVRPAANESAGPWLAEAVPFIVASGREAIGDPHHGAAEFLHPKLTQMAAYGGMAYEVANAFTSSVRRSQRVRWAEPVLTAIELSGSADALAAVAGEGFADGFRPLPARGNDASALGLPGETDEARFAAMQALDRDIWLLNGGGGNRQGTLPQ
jgi:hypothetical protein